MAANDPLLQPFRLKHLTLRNRLMSTSHEPAYTEGGLPKERYRLYHAEKAKGGLALTMIGGSSVVSVDSPQAFGNIELFRDEIVPWFAEMADAVHGHGAAIMCQITHLGRRTGWNTGEWLPVVAPSSVREPAHRAFPKEVEEFDIRRIVRDYGAAAERCKAGGLDGIEIECYGHLLDGFWSPATNKRTDEYGGSLENRMRFGLEVLREMRDRVGPAYIVGVRMVCDEDWERGLSREEGIEIARRLVASGMVDFVNVIKGHIESDNSLSHVIPGMGTPSAPHLELAQAVRGATGIPIFHAARISDVATARHAVASGILDMVGMTRPHIADPHIAAKVARGEEHRIRPCVGASYCLDRLYEGGGALCIHNPATGREATMPHVIAPTDGPRRKIVVVGGGPAGLEAARVSAERGHDVVLFEAANEPGGQIRIAAELGRRREIIGIVDWRVAEAERAGAVLRFNAYAEAADVLAEEPEIVIVATGGLPNTGFLDAGGDLVTTSWDILTGAARPGEHVMVYDDNGAHPGMMAAEFLARAGARVDLVTPERMVAPLIGNVNHPVYMRAFRQHNVGIVLNERLIAVRRDGNRLSATLHNEYADVTEERRYDQIVVEHGTLPVDELYFALKPGSRNLGELDHVAFVAGRPQTLETNPDGRYRLYRIGDAVQSRNIHAAIYDALRLCHVM
jgi:2,4-dienoyl-CoA reductase-like NADH-dependent reductase (Old Yellow Enzyme family)/thioredoxin reductase